MKIMSDNTVNNSGENADGNDPSRIHYTCILEINT